GPVDVRRHEVDRPAEAVVRHEPRRGEPSATLAAGDPRRRVEPGDEASQTVDRPATSGDAAVVTAATEDALHPVDQAVDDLRPQPDQHLRWPAVPDTLEQPLHGPLDRADRVGDETTDPLRAGLDRREHVAQAALVRLAVATDLAATGEPG